MNGSYVNIRLLLHKIENGLYSRNDKWIQHVFVRDFLNFLAKCLDVLFIALALGSLINATNNLRLELIVMFSEWNLVCAVKSSFLTIVHSVFFVGCLLGITMWLLGVTMGL